jgi:hypothetical protein
LVAVQNQVTTIVEALHGLNVITRSDLRTN